MINIKDTIMSQYANSPRMLSIISGMNDAIDPRYFIEDFYEGVYRLSTAKGFALDIWASKVGLSRNAPMSNPNAKKFGFRPSFEPWNTYPFNSATGANASYQLPDDQLRELITIKAAKNLIYATALNINKFLKLIFGEDRRAYYSIIGHMAAEYVFEFTLTPFERMLVYNLKILPVPCGVAITYREIDTGRTFGFFGTGLQNFDNGVFADG